MSDLSWALILPFFPAGIRALILDPTISDVCINGVGSIWIERNGVMELTRESIDAERLDAAIEQIARSLDQDISAQYPFLDTRLPNGARLAAVHSALSPAGASVTIRKFNGWFTTSQLVERGSLPKSVQDRVLAEILGMGGPRRNVLISGGTGSGKTTMLNAFIAHVPAGDRMVVIEKPMELDIKQENVARWEARDAIQGRSAVSVAELLVAALRQRPDRILVGEVRDESAYDMLQAMNTGHDGSMTTVHANTALSALERVSTLALAAHPNLNQGFMRSQTASAIHFVLQVRRDQSGRRYVTEFSKVVGYNAAKSEFEMDLIYKA